MSTPIKVNVVSYGGVKPGMVVAGNAKSGARTTVFDAATATNGSYVFYKNGKLKSWDVDLPELANGSYMFDDGVLTSFNAALPKLTDGTNMFHHGFFLTSFNSNLPELTNGTNMFYDGVLLTSFNAALPKLTNGTSMFRNCALDEDSILRILNSIPTYTGGSHSLNLGKRTNYLNSAEVAELLGEDTPIAAKQYTFKGWTLIVES